MAGQIQTGKTESESKLSGLEFMIITIQQERAQLTHKFINAVHLCLKGLLKSNVKYMHTLAALKKTTEISYEVFRK